MSGYSHMKTDDSCHTSETYPCVKNRSDQQEWPYEFGKHASTREKSHDGRVCVDDEAERKPKRLKGEYLIHC